jgi:hypothetical protein
MKSTRANVTVSSIERRLKSSTAGSSPQSLTDIEISRDSYAINNSQSSALPRQQAQLVLADAYRVIELVMKLDSDFLFSSNFFFVFWPQEIIHRTISRSRSRKVLPAVTVVCHSPHVEIDS